MQAVFPRLDGGLVIRGARGLRVNARLLRAGTDAVVFEAYGPQPVCKAGESLESVSVLQAGRGGYGGPARVAEVLSTGLSQIVTAVPTAPWRHEGEAEQPEGGALTTDVDTLLRDWEAGQRLSAEFQRAVSNLRSFLTRLSNWAAPINLAVEAADGARSPGWAGNLAEGIYAVVGPQLSRLFEQYEEAAAAVPAELVEARRALARQELHPLILCAPLLHRSVTKPLGYSGDYEMVNMILRNGMEGEGVYAWVVNAYFLRTGIAEGHRNRIARLTDILGEEARRAESLGRPLRVLNVGCGPADEVARLIGRDPLSERCEFSLVDFNAQTIEFATGRLEEAVREHGRRPRVEFIRRSVNDLLKEASRGQRVSADAEQYDLIYCAGLFDYLSDKVCARLLGYFHDRVAAGGRVVATNVHPGHNSRATMEDLAEWPLILRDQAQMRGLAPSLAVDVNVDTEAAGTNVFLDFRRAGETNAGDCHGTVRGERDRGR